MVPIWEDLRLRNCEGWKRRHRHATTGFLEGDCEIRAGVDDPLFEYLRYPWFRRSQELRRLREPRALCRSHRREQPIKRSSSSFARSEADSNPVLFGGSVARAL